MTDRVVTIAADEIDAANASEFEAQVCAAITASHRGHVIVDITAATFIDSRCINAMAGAERFAAASGSTLSWRGLQPQAAHVIALTGLEI